MPEVNPFAILILLGIVAAVVGAWIWVALRIAFERPFLPPYTPRIVPWGAGSVLLALVAWVALMIAVPMAFRVVVGPSAPKPANPGLPAEPPSPTRLMTLSALQNMATLLVVPMTLALTAGARRRDFGLAGPGLARQFGSGMLGYPLLAPLIFGTMFVAITAWGRTPHPLEMAIQQDKTPGKALILVLAGVVFAPIAEELVFRGLLLGWLTRIALKPRPDPGPDAIGPEPAHHPIFGPDTTFGLPPIPFADDPHNPYAAPVAGSTSFTPNPTIPKAPAIPSDRFFSLLQANVIVSLLFAALHGAVWPTPIPIFFLSLGLGFLYQRTGSLVAPIALHMTFNGISTLIMFVAVGAGGGAPQDPKAPNPIPGPAWVAQIRSEDFRRNFIDPIGHPRIL